MLIDTCEHLTTMKRLKRRRKLLLMRKLTNKSYIQQCAHAFHKRESSRPRTKDFVNSKML